ncbi:MAG: alkaline phosphatase family protein [Terriglobales bacterium]
MPARLRRLVAALLFACLTATAAFGSAYNGRPRLVVLVVIDALRPDLLERQRPGLVENGFRLFLERGASFTNCHYDHAATWTTAGHATLLTGAHPSAHGISANYWWDARLKKAVTPVEDDATQLIGASKDAAADAAAGASPHHLLASTLGDELKLATAGKSRVYAVSLKDTAAVLAGGRAADAAYWIQRSSGAFVTSSYYMAELPEWVRKFNESGRAERLWNREWKDEEGTLMGATPRQRKDGETSFYWIVGATPFGSEYTFDFARELIVNEKLGSGPATDLLILSLSSNDLLLHNLGPDSPAAGALVRATDRQLADFVDFLGRQLGLANVWMVLTADHGFEPTAEYAARFRFPSDQLPYRKQVQERLNKLLSESLSPGRPRNYVNLFRDHVAFVSAEAFAEAGIRDEAEAERRVGEALLKAAPFRGYYTRAQISSGSLPPDDMSRKYAHSYLPYGGWYVMGMLPPYHAGETDIRAATGVPYTYNNHGSPYAYNTHVPLAFYGLPFQPGTYRTESQPIDMAATLSSLLGITPPTHASGRVLSEALAPAPGGSTPPATK